MPAHYTNRLIPLLYVGDAHSPVVTRLCDYGFGVIVAEGIDRALHLLTQFRVAAVVDDVPALPQLLRLAALGTPVILLAAANADWGGPRVRILRRDSPASVIGEIVQQFTIDAAAA